MIFISFCTWPTEESIYKMIRLRTFYKSARDKRGSHFVHTGIHVTLLLSGAQSMFPVTPIWSIGHNWC
jgi:hypothetical protein